MTERLIYTLLLYMSFATALIVFISLFFISAPYGRHRRPGWGAMIPSRLGWLVMEAPSAILFAVLFWLGEAPKNSVTLSFLLLWEAHYIHRAFIYPLRISDGQNRMPVSVPIMAFIFNLGNAYLNARYLFGFSGGYPESWLLDARFIIGVILFWIGYGINRWADRVLLQLRRGLKEGYQVPYGGLYRWVSCPNYLGEIIEWAGWALATWSLAGLAFAVWTFANLAPRAQAHHQWYRGHFTEYPKERKVLIPGVW